MSFYKQYKKKTFTVDDILNLEPCTHYSRRRLKKLFKGRKWITVSGVLKLPIVEHDKFWLLLHLFNSKQKQKIAYALLRKIGVKKVKNYWKILLASNTLDYYGSPHAEFWAAYEPFEEWCSDIDLNHEKTEQLLHYMQKYLIKFGYL